LGAVDAAGAAKLAEAASRYEHSRFILCSVTGADRPERASGALGDILAAKHHAERRLAELDMPWSILRFGQLTETPGTARIRTTVSRDTRLALSRDDAALTIVEAVSRSHLARQAIVVLDGDRQVADALDAIPPRPLPPPDTPPTGTVASLGAAQSDNPPDASDMIAPDAVPLDADVEWEGDGPAPIEPVDNEEGAVLRGRGRPPIPERLLFREHQQPPGLRDAVAQKSTAKRAERNEKRFSRIAGARLTAWAAPKPSTP
jgi:hypothetical protein